MGAGTVPGALAGSWKLIPPGGVPCPALIQGEVLVLWQLDMSCFADGHGRPMPF